VNLFSAATLLFISFQFLPLFSAVNLNLDEGIRLFNERKDQEAKVFFQEVLKKDENNAEANYYTGRIFLRLRDQDEAADYLEKAVELDENNADYHYWLGNAIIMRAQNANVFKRAWLAKKAIKQFEKTVEIDSAHLRGHIGCANFYLRAPSIMGGGKDKAQKSIDKISELDPIQGLLFKADLLAQDDKPDEAMKLFDEFDKQFDKEKHNYSFYNRYGYYLLQEEKIDKAIEMFKKQVALAPDQPNPYDSLGEGLQAAGRLEEALVQYKKASELNPEAETYKKHIKEVEEELK